MSTPADFIAELVTKLGTLPSSPVEGYADLRFELSTLVPSPASGSSQFHIAAWVRFDGQFTDSNTIYETMGCQITMAAMLSSVSAERAWTRQNMLSDQSLLTSETWYRSMASVYEILVGSEPDISSPPVREANVVYYTVEFSLALQP